MKKKFISKPLLIVIIIIVLISLLIAILITYNPTDISKVRFQNNKILDVKIADNDETRQQGLMYVKELDKDSGMLFIFDHEEILDFWMKNTLIPLDIMFIDNNKKIINIEKGLPCEKDPCKIYSSKLPAKYVVEANLGYSERNNITLGDPVDF